MRLFSKHYPGPGDPLVILHGLYGNHANWQPLARLLATDFNVHVLDARNHGHSPWAASMSLAEMASDVAETLAELGLSSVHLIGHSMGGKTAMLLAQTQASLVKSLSVVDIAPVDYHNASDGVVQALLRIDLGAIASRSEADTVLAESIKAKAVRDFLLTNLQRGESGQWRWRFNLPVLAQSFREITGWPPSGGRYPGPTLFIKGELSDYVLPEHQSQITSQFPNAQFKIVNGAGHWVHSEKPEAVLRLLRNFLVTASGSSSKTAP